MFSKVIAFCIIQAAILIAVTSVLADQPAYQKEIRVFSPDSAEYQVISEEEAFELHFSEDEYEPSIIEEYSPLDGYVSLQTGSTVTFCNEADCASVTVVFGGVSHPASLLVMVGFFFTIFRLEPTPGLPWDVIGFQLGICMSMVLAVIP